MSGDHPRPLIRVLYALLGLVAGTALGALGALVGLGVGSALIALDPEGNQGDIPVDGISSFFGGIAVGALAGVIAGARATPMARLVLPVLAPLAVVAFLAVGAAS